MVWRWLEDSNLPPLAYEASALPDELSQRMKIDKRIAAPLPAWKRASLDGPETGAASKSGRSQCQRARRHWRRSRSCVVAVADMRARECARARGTRVMSGSSWRWSVGHLPSCLIGGGGDPAPVIPVSVSSLGWPDHSCGRRSPNRPCTRQYAASRSVDPTVRWRR